MTCEKRFRELIQSREEKETEAEHDNHTPILYHIKDGYKDTSSFIVGKKVEQNVLIKKNQSRYQEKACYCDQVLEKAACEVSLIPHFTGF